MKYYKVEQLENKNQFIIRIKTEKSNHIIFQSYNSMIADYDINNKKLTLFKNWDYSKTTLKHLYIFIRYYGYIIKNNTRYYLYNEIDKVKNKKRFIQEMINKKVIGYKNI